MTKQYKNMIISILLSAAVNLLVSCSPKTSVQSSSQAGAAPQSVTAQGTSDSGGCNGINNKCLDSYIIDPTQLPAFNKIVKPLLDNIKSEKKDGALSTYYQVFKMKTWYLAPVSLDEINNDVLGISFVKSNTQQIARQSMKAVWIDSRIFDKMSEVDQGQLLVHEMVMTLYFLRFTSLKELCELTNIISANHNNPSCSKIPSYFEKEMAPEKERPLNDADNEKIRSATGWVFQYAKNPVNEVEFINTLNYYGFDKRMFNPANYKEKKTTPNENIKISKKELIDAIKSSELTGNMPNICSNTEGTISAPCKISMSDSGIKMQSMNIPGLQFTVTQEGQELSTFIGGLGDEVSLTPSLVYDEETVYSITAVSSRETFSVGDQVDMGILLFRKTDNLQYNQLMLESIVVRKGVIVSIDKTRSPVCQTLSPKETKPFESGFIIHKEQKGSLLLERSMSTIQPVSLCTKDNVK